VYNNLGLKDDTGICVLSTLSSNLGINNDTPIYSVDITGDINFTGDLFRGGDLFSGSRWSCNSTGLYVESNVSIGTSCNAIYGLNVGGDVNFTGTLYNNDIPFQTSRWSCNAEGNFTMSNIGIKTTSKSNFSLDVDGDINFTGTLYNSNVPFQTSRWSSNSNGIYVMSNVGINAPADPTAAVSIGGDIYMTSGFRFKGLQISKSDGSMNNISQQVTNIPGLSNTSNNIFFYNGLLMKGLRLSAGDPLSSQNVMFASSNLQGFVASGSNVTLSIPSSNGVDAFRFVTGSSSNEALTLTGQGRLGIGISTPMASLHVNGGVLVGGQSFVLSNSANPYMVVQNNGVGTALMGLASSTSVFSTDAVAGDYIIKTFTGGRVILQSSNAGSAICINTNNNVGIRNTGALYPLDVNGDVNFTGTLRKNGVAVKDAQWSNLQSNVFIMGSNVVVGGSNALNNFHVQGGMYVSGNVGLGVPGASIQLDLSTDSARKLTTTAWLTGSDMRVKKNIMDADLDICYSNVKNLSLRRFEWDSNYYPHVQDRTAIGWIAQEVEQVFPHAIVETNDFGFVDFKNLNTDQLVKCMYGALKKCIGMLEKNYTDFVCPSDIVFDGPAVVGFDKDGKLVDKFSLAMSFGISSGGNHVVSSGKIPLKLVPNCEIGNYIIPCVGQDDSIEYYSIGDLRVSFGEYKLAVGKVIGIIGDKIEVLVKVA
jgi:hypothetical protein